MINGMDTRVIVRAVQDGLALLEAEQNGAAPADQTLMEELEAAAEDVTARLEELIDDLAKYQRLWLSNKIDKQLEALQDGDIIQGGRYTKERWTELRPAFLTFQRWLATPIAEGGPAVVEVLSRRYVPPKATK